MRNHPFFNEKVIFDENLWFLKKLFCSKISEIHSEFDKRKKKYVLFPDSKISKSHQIEPKYTNTEFLMCRGHQRRQGSLIDPDYKFFKISKKLCAFFKTLEIN